MAPALRGVLTKLGGLWRSRCTASWKPVKESETPHGTNGALRSDGPDSVPPSVSLEAEVPEALFEGMREFIRNHPDWDQYSVITSALAGFLFQNGSSDRSVKDHYLAGLFSES